MADHATECDVLVRGGLVVDGTGAPAWRGDIAVAGGRIVYAGPEFTGSARETIEAEGLLVTPGFVDIHTHYDGQALWSQEMSPSSSHGVTTVVTGNCGVGFAPCRDGDQQRMIALMEGVEDIPGVVMAEGLDWSWETFPQFLDALASRPRDIDVAALLPHSPLRVFVMGERGARREPATAEDCAQMKALTAEALAAGALGFASSRLLIHRTAAGEFIPSYAAAEAELVAVAEALREADTGVLQMVLDAPFAPWSDELGHLVRVAEAAGRPATFTLGTPNEGFANWHEALEICEAATARGLTIVPQVLPRPIGMISGLDLSTHAFALCPSWAELADLPLAGKVERLRDPQFRARILAEAPQEGHPLAMMTRNWNWMFELGNPPNYAPSPDSSIAARAARLGVTPEEVAMDVMIGNGDGGGLIYNTLGNFYEGSLDSVLDLIRREDTVVGLGDGGAHYSAICDASYPTFLMTYWVRDRDGERLSIEEAVRILSAKPARTMGLSDRGILAPGYKADINVIDAAGLQLHAPHIKRDLPAGGRRLDQGATGYVATLCNGVVIRRNDRPTGARPGTLVRGAQAAPAKAPAMA